MLDFLIISTRPTKRGVIEIYPRFRLYPRSSDLMIRGGDFYAIWLEERGLWSTDEQDALQLIDHELDKFAEENRDKFDGNVKVMHMWDSESGMIDAWHKYCQKQMRDSFRMLDERLIFSNTETNKNDYASKRLSYPLEPGDITAYDKLISTLYTPEERHKIEWAIGAIVSGESKKLQKFMVLYGAAGTGKSTILNIIQQLFEGYYSVFDAKALGSNGNQFALEAFKKNPLVAIQHDGDLSKIEDNTRLNSLVSHELMSVNEKHKGLYENQFKCFLFMGTNRPVKITDAKSGLIRRLIDVSPSGAKLDPKEYKKIMKQVTFELGAIAYHCQELYLNEPDAYDDYIPVSMLGASNDFYNFVLDSYHIFKKEDGISLKAAWEMYNVYCEEAKVQFPYSQRVFKEELKNYFWDYKERIRLEDDTRIRSYYAGFRTDKFEGRPSDKKATPVPDVIAFDSIPSVFDKECSNCAAQYATANGTPTVKWDNVTTKLGSIDTSAIHFVKVPENHIVIDFDIPDDNGGKSFEKNLEAASKWPATYAELSKSGAGIHLHYIYNGDVSKLSKIYDDHIEVKVFSGKSSLRRKLTKCNNLPIATISSGLPLKGESKMVNFESIKSEKGLRTLIKRNLNKEIHPGTKPSIDFIYKILEDAYSSDLKYDVSDMRNSILAFAASSTHQSDYCIKLVNKMQFHSDEPSETVQNEAAKLVFYDIEVFPNLFLVNWKVQGEGKPVVRMINPSPSEVEDLMKFNLVGFNCRRYDNHILYARMMGYSNEQLYKLSQRIINQEPNCFFGEAYNVSYTDVYDFAATKQSLKKWEIELGIHHQELGLPWDQPVPEDRWIEVAEYCDNDVLATEAVFNHLKGDFTARQILADLAGGSVNDTTNSLTGKIMFGKNRKPQSEFHYRKLSEPVHDLSPDIIDFLTEAFPEMMAQRHGPANSLLPYFEGYKYEYGKSTYKGVEVGEGGRVFAQPGIWLNVALLDITSMHPHSAMAEALFGARFTRRFREIVYGRVHIKHEAWGEVNKILDGKLTPYIQKVLDGEMTSGDLADALKIAINSVYGLTAASFDNLFKDPRNTDNIVAKRGALFMVDLQEEVEKRGFTVCHIKTDSIKIPDATIGIIKFVMEFGKKYGYTFEHEATYDRMCLVNNAVYIAKYKDVEWCEENYGYIPSKQLKNAGTWTATGKQFQVPYVFKKLFSKESIIFDDICEAKEVKSAIYLDRNESLPVGEHDYHFVGRVGLFCPVKPGCGGAELVRESKDKDGNIKYDSVTGTLKPDKTPYRWLEAEMVKALGKEGDIDYSYHNKLVDDAVDAISEYGDFEWFVSDNSEPLKKDEALPWLMPCGDAKYETCYDCPNFCEEHDGVSCGLYYDISHVILKERI